jgi:hypothetical protein
MAKIKTTKANKAKTIAAPLQTEVSFNKNGKHVKAMIEAGIAAETSVISNAVVATIKAGWLACKAGEMTPAHADHVLIAIRAGVAAANDATVKRGEKLDGARVSDTRTALKIFDWKCRANLVDVLATIETLTFEGLVSIVRWMKGTPQKKAHWKADLITAPSKAELLGVIRKVKGRTSKGGKRGGFKKGKGVVGMPMSDAVAGLGHVLKCAKAFNKAHASHFASAGDRKLFAAVLDNISACFAPTRALIKSREEKAASDAAK